MMRQLTKRALTLTTVLLAAAGVSLSATDTAQAYAPQQQTLYSAQNAGSCNKNPCILYPKSAELPGGRLIASFEDSEGPVVGQTMPIYKSDDQGDSWQKLTDLKAPAALSNDPAYAPYTSNWTNPYFYVLPQDLGTLKAGTLLLANVVSGAGTNGDGNARQNLAIALYASIDQGATWSINSIIATGPNQAQDPVWEPYLMMYNGQLITYYSDENDYLGYNATTGVPTIDPANTTAKDSGGQVLVHRTWNGSGAWSGPVIDVAGLQQDMGGGKTEIGGGRPGMTNVVPTNDGKWLLTFEYFGGGDNVHYKIADNPLRFFADNTPAGNNITTLPVSSGSGPLSTGGSPVTVRLPDGRLVFNAYGSGDIWINDSGTSTGAWKQYHTSVGAGYSRNLQYVSATGRLEILSAPFGNGPVTYGQVDIGQSVGAYYSIVNRKTGQVLTPQTGKTQDAQFTGNTPDLITSTATSGNAGQYWHIAKKGTASTLLNKSGGRAAGIWQGQATQGANLAQWVDDGATDKLWNLVGSGDGYVRLQSTANTSLYATGAAPGGAVSLQTAISTTGNAAADDAQEWQFVPDFTTTTQTQYKIVNRGSGKVLAVLGGSRNAGANVVQYADTGSPDQVWRFAQLTNGNIKITDNGSGKVLGIIQGSTTQDAQAVQWNDTGSADQQWKIVQNGAYFIIQNTSSGLNLGVRGGSGADGAPAIQWPADGSLNQQWQLVQVSAL